MADKSVFHKNTLGQLATPKKSATVETAFDSDESDWSDDGGQLNAAVKQPVQPVPLPTEKNKEKEKELQNVSHTKASVDTLEPRRNSIQQDPSSSPYFINISKDSKEKSSPSSLKQKPKVASPVKADVRRNSVKKLEDDDDWDEESCIANQPVKKAENVFFQAPTSTSTSKQHVPAPKTTTIKKPNMVDWSETYSAGGSDSEAEEVENHFVDDENLRGEASSDHFMTKSDSLEKNESIETLEEKIDTISIKDDFDNHFIKKRGSISQNYVEPLDIRDGSLAAQNASPVFLKDNFSATGEEDRNNLFTTLPSSSSAANLFIVPSSSTTALAPQFSKSSFDLTEAGAQESSTQMKKPKPSSAKKLLSRFFSTDEEKNSKNKKDEPKSPSTRKTSEPIPLSELLLSTPTSRVSNPPPPIIPLRYFPQEPSSSRMHHEVDQRGENPSGQPVPTVKRKGFFGKVKRTLGISSKSSKMRATASLKNLSPEAPPTPIISAPCLTTEHAASTADHRVISVCTKGRPANEVIVDLLKEGKRYLESTQHSPNAGGDGGAGGDLMAWRPFDFDKKEQPSNLGKLKKFSSLDILSPTSSKLTASESSLVDNDCEEADETCSPRTSKTTDMSYYCSQAIDNAPNRQIIYNLIEDFCCVLDKSFGEHDQLKNDNGNLFSEIDCLRKALEACEACKEELNRRIQELQCELQKLQFCLEEQCQARENLERIVCELKSQLERQDELLNCLLAEKSEMAARIKQLETDMWNLKNQISDFSVERDEFSKSFKGFEGTKNKCHDLQVALAECCEKHDILQKEILDLRKENNEIKLSLDKVIFEKNKEMNDIFREVLDLRKENNELKLKLDECAFDKNQLLNEMETMKQAFAQEKAGLEGKICELLDGIASLEKAKSEVCRQTNSILAAHHEEMDKLKDELEAYKAKYEDEAKLREDLERKLRSAEAAARQATVTPTRSSPPSPCYTPRPYPC